jgi:hypothetical protein
VCPYSQDRGVVNRTYLGPVGVHPWRGRCGESFALTLIGRLVVRPVCFFSAPHQLFTTAIIRPVRNALDWRLGCHDERYEALVRPRSKSLSPFFLRLELPNFFAQEIHISQITHRDAPVVIIPSFTPRRQTTYVIWFTEVKAGGRGRIVVREHADEDGAEAKNRTAQR